MLNVLRPCLLVLLVSNALPGFSQDKTPSVISPAGDISKGSNMILEWTVGEAMVETGTTSSQMYTQGFHQPVLKVQKLDDLNAVAGGNTFKVFPNPTTAVINVQLEKASQTPLLVSLLDASGKLLLNNTFPANSLSLKINVQRLIGGVYILRITDPAGTLQGNYKIIKAQ
jgi:hypothetical protein